MEGKTFSNTATYQKLKGISYRRLVGSCSRMALDGSIIVEICDETIAKMWHKPVEL